MTFDQFDAIRGYVVSAVIVSVAALGVAVTFFPEPAIKARRFICAVSGLIGGLAGRIVFFLFTFVEGWSDYFAAKGQSNAEQYYGRHQAAARVIRTLGKWMRQRLESFLALSEQSFCAWPSPMRNPFGGPNSTCPFQN